VVAVNEAGASVYSASEVAREEFPELDLTLRGAISIGRRLQDPLAELVKIDPKAIGVGQYQHDVYQPLLARKLEQVVESCVNHVGVDLNTASAPLLSRVAGLRPSVARSIVEHRNTARGVSFAGGAAWRAGAGAAGLRAGRGASCGSAAESTRWTRARCIRSVIRWSSGSRRTSGSGWRSWSAARRWRPSVVVEKYLGEGVGEPTLRDILGELQKPGRDPRERFDPPKFRADITQISDLQPGLVLEGVVTNVTAFGAFVDIGVHQDGLVHISQLSDRFVKDPHSVVKAGEKLRVRVLEVDAARKRISLTARLGDPVPARTARRIRGLARVGRRRRDGWARGRPGGGGQRTATILGPAGRPGRGATERERSRRGAGNSGHNPFAKLLKR
jgi:uncharacterized protein